jgi:hypothetical protein
MKNDTDTPSAAERAKLLADRRAEQLAKTKKWIASRYEIPESEILGYNSGSCYSKAWVTTRTAADKIAAAVKGDTVNGGMLHGMSLGGITPIDGGFEVIC